MQRSSYLIAKFQWIFPLRSLIEKVQEDNTLRYTFVEQYVSSTGSCKADLDVMFPDRAHDECLRIVYESNPTFPFADMRAGLAMGDAVTHNHMKREAIMLGQVGHARLLRIHRIYLAQAMQNE